MTSNRIIRNTQYNTDEHTSVNSLYSLHLKDPVMISNELTFLWGKDSDKFPLLSMTDGQKGGWKTLGADKSLTDTQYYWPIMGKMRHTSMVVSLAQSVTTTAPGVNYAPFEVIMEDDRFIPQWGAMAPDGSRVRIQKEPERTALGKFKYTFVSKDGSAIALSNFQQGTHWVMTAPTIPGLRSDGNRSNRMGPGKMTNQFGYHRFSQGITGNMGDQVTNIMLPTETGTTSAWMPFEMYQFEMEKRQQLEEHLIYSEYNRDSNGKIHVTDLNSGGEVVPEGAGIDEMINEVGNKDTYTTLTVDKLDNTINSVFDGLSDTSIMEIVLYTGKGGAKAFHEAIMNDASSKLFYQALGDKIIQGGSDGYLNYGKYFNQYRTFDGHVITVKRAHMNDWGLKAEMQRANGDMIDGLPRDSYTMRFIDQSMIDGKRNVMTVNELGRENQIEIYKGMSKLPKVWGAVTTNIISDRKDIAWYENITSKGINMYRANTSFILEKA